MLKLIGKRIRDLRIIKTNLSQEDFANKVHLDRTYLSRIESGKQNITMENLNIICNGLEISLKDFFEPFDNNYLDGEDD